MVPIEHVYDQIRAFAADAGARKVVLFGSRAKVLYEKVLAVTNTPPVAPVEGVILSVNGLHWNTVRQEQWRVCGQNYAITPFKGVFTGAAAWKCFWSVIPISLPNSGFSMLFPETMW